MALRRQASAAEPELTTVVLYFAGRPVAQLEVSGPARLRRPSCMR